MESKGRWVWAGDPIDFEHHRNLSSNAMPIPLNAAALKYAGLDLTESQARLLTSLCVADRFVLTGWRGEAGPYPKDVAELKRQGVPLDTEYFQLTSRIWVIRVRLSRRPFDLVPCTTGGEHPL